MDDSQEIVPFVSYVCVSLFPTTDIFSRIQNSARILKIILVCNNEKKKVKF